MQPERIKKLHKITETSSIEIRTEVLFYFMMTKGIAHLFK